MQSRYYFENLKINTFTRKEDPNHSVYILKTTNAIKLIEIKKD